MEFYPISHGFMSLLVYGMLFVALIIVFNGPITFDTLIMLGRIYLRSSSNARICDNKED